MVVTLQLNEHGWAMENGGPRNEVDVFPDLKMGIFHCYVSFRVVNGDLTTVSESEKVANTTKFKKSPWNLHQP